MRRRHRRSRRHFLHGLGEPITATVAAIPWLWVAGGALIAKLLHGSADADFQRAQETRSFLMERIKSQGTLWVGGISIDDFIAANPDLLDGAKYSGGKAPSKAELANELVAVASILGKTAYAGRAYGSEYAGAATLQGRV